MNLCHRRCSVYESLAHDSTARNTVARESSFCLAFNILLNHRNRTPQLSRHSGSAILKGAAMEVQHCKSQAARSPCCALTSPKRMGADPRTPASLQFAMFAKNERGGFSACPNSGQAELYPVGGAISPLGFISQSRFAFLLAE